MNSGDEKKPLRVCGCGKPFETLASCCDELWGGCADCVDALLRAHKAEVHVAEGLRRLRLLP